MAEKIGAKDDDYCSIVQKVILGADTLYNYQKTDSISIVISNNDQIEFDFYSSASSNKELFKFFLKGLDKQPAEWTYKNSAIYYNLLPGNYTFCIFSKDDYEEINFVVKPMHNRYITSSVVLIVLVILSFFLLKYGILPSIRRKVNDWHKDSIAPLLNKYLTPGVKDELSEARKLSNKVTVKYEKATVLFADIQGFTKIVEHLNPETLIDELDRFFIYFDEVVGRLKIEKIKTIGDAYMCAGGLPKKNSTNPVEVVLAALEMQRYMLRSKNIAQRNAREFWELRIGIHTGPLISGVVGSKKLSFDIWGDTVNIASRMESSGVAGKINISGVTYELIKDFFVCEYRGKMPVKYKGETDMYFVKGIAPHLSINNEGILPNDDFLVKLQWIRYNDMEEMVLNQLRNELPSTLKYHSVKHTIDVCTQVEVLGRAEGLNSKELLLVKTAALFHDTGYMINPVKHEVQSVRFAREILPEFDYTKSEIEAISQLIMVTEKDTQPKMLMEKIIKDADLDYLGRADFIPLSEKLWEEVCHFNGKMSQNEWNKKQYEFISQHVYYTHTAKALRQVNKEIQLKKIKEFLR
jgi:class 3 adenylate cyclase/predicted metal-dependent HD superfamily phosphohydrolase